MKAIGNPLFSDKSLDRATKVRESASEIRQTLQLPKTKHTLIWRGKLLFDFSDRKPKIGYLKKIDKFWAEFPHTNFSQGNFLGYSDKAPIFYHDISSWEDPNKDLSKLNSFLDESEQSHPSLPENYFFRDLRSILSVVSEQDASILASIKGIYEWNINHKFCTICGGKVITIKGGWEKLCSTCNSKHFPRTDPVVIMLICRKNQTLLGRSKAWPEGMFSCLAGFMEPGESIEMTVGRETFEEVGIRVKNIKYVTSQPWPFPSSLMLGCYAKAESYNLTIDKTELEDARWFSKEETYRAINNKELWWPARKGSIARFMIEAWLDSKI